MASLIDRISGFFRRQARPDSGEVTTLELTRRPARVGASLERFRGETQRAEVVRKCREMYESDPRAKKMLRVLARDLVRGGFVVKADDERALEVAGLLKERLDLDQRLDDYVRMTARDGDSFLELGINGRLEIVDISRKPTLQMHRNSNEFDRFEDATRAFWWADEIWAGQDPPNDAVWFAEWQIVHARWEHDEGSRYGSPMMASGTGHWKKVQEGELDVAVRRKTRAGMKYLHVIEGASPGELEAYKEENKDVLDNPFAAVADFFSNRAGSISAVQGDTRLGEISDVQHMIATWFTAGEVPMELIAYGENLNRDVLKEKKAEYDELLPQLREWVTAELVKPVLERQWLLAGIYPPSLDYSVEWRGKQLLTAGDVRDVTEAAFRMKLLGIRDEVIAMVVAKFLPGVEPEDLFEEEGEAVSAGRIDQVLSALRPGGGL